MTKNQNGWTALAETEPGKVLYKLIVDGVWMTDPGNKDSEPDGQNINSVRIIK